MNTDAGAGQWARFQKWIDVRLPVFTYVKREYVDFPSPRNFNYWWSFGGMAMLLLAIMMASGIVLAMQYTPHVDYAYDSVERIMRDVNYGWLLRYMHMNGSSFFFAVVYIHIFRGLYYGSYKSPRELLWILGVIILLFMMVTAFTGYVLPWGQMSFWAATVITNLFSAIPLVGDAIVNWLWGAYSVDNPTLNRFYSLHYLFPFLIAAVIVVHVIALHVVGSNNPLGVEPKGPQDTVSFHPFYTMKDGVAIFVMLIVFAVVMFFAPNFLGEPENYVPADPFTTPAHIVPEWYFLPYYAVLRAVPDNFIGGWIGFTLIEAKLAGVIAMFASVMILFLVPWLDTSKVRSARFRPIYKWFFWIFVADVVVLGWVGANSPIDVFMERISFLVIGRVATAWYFFHFLILLPVLGRLERPLPLPNSIAEAVLGASKGGGALASGATAKPMEKA